jgi:hypothetical protein
MSERHCIRISDGTNWANPVTEVGWQARYGTPDPLALASYVDCYIALVNAPRKKRELVVRELRRWIRENQ